MVVIPVIDIRNGEIVHAKQGVRTEYQPIQSVLGDIKSLTDMLTAYRRVYPFSTFYIADLDAIEGRGTNSELIISAAETFPEYEFWLDAGLEGFDERQQVYPANISPVIGSEHSIEKSELSKLLKQCNNAILSLDFSEHGLIQNQYLLESKSIWPETVIIMMLHRVGSNAGIDENCLKSITTASHQHKLFVAGGIRNEKDIATLQQQPGVTGVLIASAIHNGKIGTKELNEITAL